jgi:hypothetical protein
MAFLLEYDDERSGTFEPKNKTVVLSLVSSVFFKQMPCQDFVAQGSEAR